MVEPLLRTIDICLGLGDHPAQRLSSSAWSPEQTLGEVLPLLIGDAAFELAESLSGKGDEGLLGVVVERGPDDAYVREQANAQKSQVLWSS